MTDEITWSPDYPVNGKRPKWLADDDRILWTGLETSGVEWGSYDSGRDASAILRWESKTTIRVQSNHWAYPAIFRGYEPWAGGDAAPDDYDDAGVMFRNGSAATTVGTWGWSHNGGGSDIIGYRKRAVPTKTAEDRGVSIEAIVQTYWDMHEIATNELGYPSILEALEACPSNSERPAWQDIGCADTVTVNRMTEAEALSWLGSYETAQSTIGALHTLGIIRDETTAERFTRETGHEATPAVLAALAWSTGK